MPRRDTLHNGHSGLERKSPGASAAPRSVRPEGNRRASGKPAQPVPPGAPCTAVSPLPSPLSRHPASPSPTCHSLPQPTRPPPVIPAPERESRTPLGPDRPRFRPGRPRRPQSAPSVPPNLPFRVKPRKLKLLTGCRRRALDSSLRCAALGMTRGGWTWESRPQSAPSVPPNLPFRAKPRKLKLLTGCRRRALDSSLRCAALGMTRGGVDVGISPPVRPIRPSLPFGLSSSKAQPRNDRIARPDTAVLMPPPVICMLRMARTCHSRPRAGISAKQPRCQKKRPALHRPVFSLWTAGGWRARVAWRRRLRSSPPVVGLPRASRLRR